MVCPSLDLAIPDSSPLRHSLGTTPDRVDIWTLPLQTTSQVVEELQSILSDDECQRARRFYAAENQNLFITGRGMLRKILSAYASASPESLVFELSGQGKPRLLNHPGLHFNLAHSGGRALYAVARHYVGVDIEWIKPLQDWQKISRRFFSKREAEELMNLGPSEQIPGFFACWTRKEAFLKATGEGIAAGLDKFYTGANPNITEGEIEENGQPAQWYFKHLHVGNHFAGALVTRFPSPHLRQFDFQQTKDCLMSVNAK